MDVFNTKLFEPRNLVTIAVIAVVSIWVWKMVGSHVAGIPQSMKGPAS